MNFPGNPCNQPLNQQGVAMLLSLLILLMLTMLGVSSFHNSHIQERSAGNMRIQTVAFEAAAAGASSAINFWDSYKASAPDEFCGTLGHEGWANPTGWVNMGTIGDATLKQRMYCLADEYPDAEGGRPLRSQLFVLSRGEVTSGGDIVSQRDVEVRLDIGGTGVAGDGCGAICFPSCNPGIFDFPNSNSFEVDGNGGPAITGGCQTMTDEIREGIRNNRIGNYIGGVATTSPGSPWTDSVTVEQFRANVEASAQAAQAGGGCQGFCYSAGDVVDMGNTVYGTVAVPQITYIHGSAAFGGDISGAGIMFVNGGLSWNGTPNFKGLIVTLGGSFTIDGGGTGGDHAGSVVILNTEEPDVILDFGDSSFYNNGGGTALYKFNCDALWAAQALLDEAGQALWSPECETGPGSPYLAGPGELIIASWRENIGWREEFFGSN
ncbi:MAG: PilX N-terminal domain-containing pilus assembly protein [Xanthomonadales bacterium]|nr:PilX N-terminal domain-containing pilus assembly protein [Xanthomonadales bacterium]